MEDSKRSRDVVDDESHDGKTTHGKVTKADMKSTPERQKLIAHGWKYFKLEDEGARLALASMGLLAAVLWAVSIYSLIGPLKTVKAGIQRQIMTGTLGSIGVSVLGYLLFGTYQILNAEKPMYGHLGPEYDSCQSGPDSLTNEELKGGAVGLIDYICSATVYKRVVDASERVRTGAFYVTYVVFALFVFIFTGSGGLTGMKRGNPMLLHLVRLLLIYTLMTITFTRFSTHWVISIFPLILARHFSLMMSAIAGIVLLYIVSSVAV